jgi:phosphoenolpyruvate phosphomutase
MPLRLLGVHDALTATLATRANVDGLWLGSLSVSLSLGVPDEGFLTAEDYRERVVVIRRVSALPILVDIDVGCLRHSSVANVISILAAAGANGVAIEDKAHPKVNSFREVAQQLTPTADFLEILSSALESRPTRSFAIVARSDALVAGLAVRDALRLVSAYRRTGIDGVLIQCSNPDPTQLLQVLEGLDAEVVRSAVGIIPTAYPDIAAATWLQHGASVVIYANQLVRASVPAMVEVADAIVRDDARRAEDLMVTIRALLELLAGQNA